MIVVANVITAVCVLLGASTILLSGIAMYRAQDALARINVFSPATGLGMPLIVIGAYAHTLVVDGFGVVRLFMAIVAVLSLVIVSSVASNVLSRSVFVSGAPVWRETSPNRLAEPRDPAEDAGL
ncbi:cation:proton antiporter [Brevibacterium samyangense]|uniref:Cation:proton antiporter n=1 Tax=Brevibacterium samyangense TaxID=366888 RepID=A0ABP5EN32_9MICO